MVSGEAGGVHSGDAARARPTMLGQAPTAGPAGGTIVRGDAIVVIDATPKLTVHKEEDVRELSWPQLNRALLARQLLLDRTDLAPATAVERVGLLQTQYSPSA